MSATLYKDLSYQIIGAAMEVHRTLGPNFMKEVYVNALAHELSLRKIRHETNWRLPVNYKGALVGDYTVDLFVENKIVLEVATPARTLASHRAEAVSALATTGQRLAILLNFGEATLHFERVEL